MEMVKEFDDETNQQEILEYIGNESFHHLVMMGRPEEITDFFADYADYFAQVRSRENRNILDKIDAYVKEHYMEKISLRSLGEMFYINNVYLGQLYKKRYRSYSGIIEPASFREGKRTIRRYRYEDLSYCRRNRIWQSRLFYQ